MAWDAAWSRSRKKVKRSAPAPPDTPLSCPSPQSHDRLRLLAPLLRLLGQETPQPVAHAVGLLRRPAAKSLAGLHAELAGLDLLDQERVWAGAAVEIGDQDVADVEREVETHQVRLLERPEHCEPRPEPAL